MKSFLRAPKTKMTIGLLIYGIGALIGSQATDLVQATIALAVIGIGNAGTAALNPLLTDLIPRKRTAELIGVGSAVWSFVQPLGSVLAGLVVGWGAGSTSAISVSPVSVVFWSVPWS